MKPWYLKINWTRVLVLVLCLLAVVWVLIDRAAYTAAAVVVAAGAVLTWLERGTRR